LTGGTSSNSAAREGEPDFGSGKNPREEKSHGKTVDSLLVKIGTAFLASIRRRASSVSWGEEPWPTREGELLCRGRLGQRERGEGIGNGSEGTPARGSSHNRKYSKKNDGIRSTHGAGLGGRGPLRRLKEVPRFGTKSCGAVWKKDEFFEAGQANSKEVLVVTRKGR